jgi:threonine/homoserine/homoserine lactone efflux protein
MVRWHVLWPKMVTFLSQTRPLNQLQSQFANKDLCFVDLRHIRMLVQGILLGFSLSFLIGPLLFAVVQAGIAQGFRAGVAVAAGIWVSDALFLCLILCGVETLEAMTALEGFRFWAGILGGMLLLIFGLTSFFSSEHQAVGAVAKKKRTYRHWWLRGFLINTVNPGTLFFWLGTVSAVVIPSGWHNRETTVFFGGMLGALVLTDTLKAWAAKSISSFLTPGHIRNVQKTIGLLLVTFGLGLIFNVLKGYL